MPIPKRAKGESNASYRSKVIEAEIHHGKPQKQAVAIGYSIVPETRGAKKRGRGKGSG